MGELALRPRRRKSCRGDPWEATSAAWLTVCRGVRHVGRAPSPYARCCVVAASVPSYTSESRPGTVEWPGVVDLDPAVLYGRFEPGIGRPDQAANHPTSRTCGHVGVPSGWIKVPVIPANSVPKSVPDWANLTQARRIELP